MARKNLVVETVWISPITGETMASKSHKVTQRQANLIVKETTEKLLAKGLTPDDYIFSITEAKE